MYLKNKARDPEILLKTKHKRPRDLFKLLCTSKTRQKFPEIISNYFKNKTQVMPEILSNYVLQIQRKGCRDSFKLLQKLDKGSPRFLRTTLKNEKQGVPGILLNYVLEKQAKGS